MRESSIARSFQTPCALCGSADVRLYHDQGYRKVMKCRSCGLVFAQPIPSLEQKHETERLAYEGELLPEAAEFFENCHRDFTEDAVIGQFRGALDWIESARSPGRMLDVGPGTGIFLHLARERGWEPVGIDLCELSAVKAKEEFDIEVDVGSFIGHDYEPESFDCITMLDVVEHSRDPLAFLQRAYELLRPGGVVYVAVPNQRSFLTVVLDRWIRMGLPPGKYFLERLYVRPHLFYFNPAVLRHTLEAAGFEVEDVRGGNVYLGRYRLPLWMRVPLEVVLQLGGLVGMSARLMALARKPRAVSAVFSRSAP